MDLGDPCDLFEAGIQKPSCYSNFVKRIQNKGNTYKKIADVVSSSLIIFWNISIGYIELRNADSVS